MDKCGMCGKDATIMIHSNGEKSEPLCAKCHNIIMAELTNTDFPNKIPEYIFFEDCNKEMHKFDIELMIFPHCKSLKARETADTEYLFDVYGKLEDSFLLMWEKLIKKITKMLSVKYIVDDSWKNDRVVGYIKYNSKTERHDVVIDGKTYSWNELGTKLGTYEGFQIKIEISDITEDVF
jgi:hypothetical protein